MDDVELQQTFEHEGLEYLVSISSSGGFAFELVRGNTRKGSVKRDPNDLWWDETPVYEDVELVTFALPVFRKAGDILIGWFYSKRPWRVHFSASTDRKVKIYRWFARRLEQRLPDEYQLVEFPDGEFNFYRGEDTG